MLVWKWVPHLPNTHTYTNGIELLASGGGAVWESYTTLRSLAGGSASLMVGLEGL